VPPSQHAFKYRFTDIDTLVGDFLRDVEKLA